MIYYVERQSDEAMIGDPKISDGSLQLNTQKYSLENKIIKQYAR